ncbi:MAG: efflux RND transporter periplasmic adaptor subunit [Bacteroidales bacterium]|jgi:membrane fusion protein (multidrug efflux system)|nr:efflux RND transporter periplasmic adaptor subunit [Bacteroidales bacterium]
MKTKHISIIALLAILIMSCGSPDSQKQISRLESKKAELQEKIAKIDKQIIELKTGLDDTENIRLVPVHVETVQERRFQNYFTVQGNVTSDNNIQVPAEYSGIVKTLHYNEGDYVQKGTVLAEIDNALLLRQKAELETNLELAITSYERQKRLWEQEIGSEMQYLQAKNQKEGLENRLKTLNQQLSQTKITAPINGTIDKVFIKAGENIQMSMPAFRIVQLSRLKVEAEVSEKYVADIHKGDSVIVSFSSIDTEFVSAIQAISQVIDPDTRTFTIEIKVPENLDFIKPNMLSRVKVFNYINPNATSIPLNIIQKNELGNFVFVVSEAEGNKIAERRSIVVKQNNTKLAEIEAGLKVGEVVITDGYQNLSNGQQIEILK